jgi:transposase
VKGRKRHLLVDTNGLVIQAVVHTAGLHDREGGKLVVEALAPVKERFPRLKHVWVDSGYRGTFVSWVKEQLGWSIEVVQHSWAGLKGVWTPPGSGSRAAADQTTWLPGFAEALGCRAHIRVAQYRPEAVQGLRILACQQRDVDLCRAAPAYGQATRTSPDVEPLHTPPLLHS